MFVNNNTLFDILYIILNEKYQIFWMTTHLVQKALEVMYMTGKLKSIVKVLNLIVLAAFFRLIPYC